MAMIRILVQRVMIAYSFFVESMGVALLKQFFADAVFYPTLWWSMLLARKLKVRNWWDDVNEHIVLGAYPFDVDVARLAQEGVTAVVNTCQEYAGPVAEYEKHSISQLRIPTIDFTHPSFEDVERAVEFMDRQIASGGRIYVHCKAGRARSATVVACWLIKNRKMTADAAQQFLLSKRSHVNRRLALRPVVQQFEQSYTR